ncbi:MAG: hypothetical protein GY702_21580 [Desulfobulbaceae bacterium]|nr:hypothetical protein [Desulfobulbaceae bacterium]
MAQINLILPSLPQETSMFPGDETNASTENPFSTHLELALAGNNNSETDHGYPENTPQLIQNNGTVRIKEDLTTNQNLFEITNPLLTNDRVENSQHESIKIITDRPQPVLSRDNQVNSNELDAVNVSKVAEQLTGHLADDLLPKDNESIVKTDINTRTEISRQTVHGEPNPNISLSIHGENKQSKQPLSRPLLAADSSKNINLQEAVVSLADQNAALQQSSTIPLQATEPGQTTNTKNSEPLLKGQNVALKQTTTDNLQATVPNQTTNAKNPEPLLSKQNVALKQTTTDNLQATVPNQTTNTKNPAPLLSEQNVALKQSPTNLSQAASFSQPTIRKDSENPPIKQSLTLKQHSSNALPAANDSFSFTSKNNPINQEQGIIAQRLQEIINYDNEKGTVAIKTITQQQPASGNSFDYLETLASNRALMFTSNDSNRVVLGNKTNPQTEVKIPSLISNPAIQISTSDDNGDISVLAEGFKVAVLPNPPQQLSGIRHDTNQQYFEAKAQLQNLSGDEQNMQGNQQGNEQPTQSNQANQSMQTSATQGSGEPVGVFSIPASYSQDQPLHSVVAVNKPQFTQPETIVKEQEIVQQVLNRFQLSRRSLDSQINLRLHPAELGEMKIDLTVKEGSIRANVVAQSQFVQEVMEKNIGKLKAVLEDQGFTIDEINVTSQSESVGEFNLSDKQFSSQDSSASKQDERTMMSEPFNLAELSNQENSNTSDGVDLKV